MKTSSTLWDWSQQATPVHDSPYDGALRIDLDVDVAIVGAGITGLTTALQLERAGLRVVVLEARTVGTGVTGGTSAHLTEAIDHRYSNVARDFGPEAARLVARSSRTAIDHIAATAAALGIECSFERVPGYLYTEREEHIAGLELELEAALDAGLAVTRVEDPLPFVTRAALRFENQAQFQPIDYVKGLAQHLRMEGTRIYEHSRVVSIDEDEPCVVRTESGATVRAGYVVVATHAPLNKLLLQTKLASYRSYVVAGAVEKAPQGLFWDTEDSYHYVRSHTVDGRTFLIVGGEDHKTGQVEHPKGAYERLAAYARRFGLEHPTFTWSSQVIEPVDGLPFIGHNAMASRVLVATGFSGNGLTFGTLAGIILSDTILKHPNRYRDLYEATRIKPVASAGHYVSENIDYPKHLMGDRLKPAEGRSTRDVAPGEGKILSIGGERVAAFRDDDGRLHCTSAVCTHMGCLVAFNAAEKTWDCPCHGARFDTHGEVLDGPAIEPLKRLPIVDEAPASSDSASTSGVHASVTSSGVHR